MRTYFPKLLLLSLALFVSNLLSARAEGLIPDRRKDQYPTEPAHLFVPLPYSMPGIGQGFFLLGNLGNILETTADANIVYITGDAKGYAGLFNEIPLISEMLLVDFFVDDISSATVNFYDKRGMDTKKEDYSSAELGNINEHEVELSLNFFDRRFSLLAGQNNSAAEVKAFREPGGDLIVAFEKPMPVSFGANYYAVRLDFTDDFQDPKQGIRLRFGNEFSTESDGNEADYYVQNYGVLVYVPVGDISTLVFNYRRSDAIVKKPGNTDREAIRAELRVDCGGDAACEQTVQENINNTVNARANGSAASLGGQDFLRSYPQGRFQGAHMGFYGLEFRWNLSDENTPFDYLFWKDVRTGFQIAFFGETGSVSELAGELWDESRSSYGFGVRLVTASGSVYRFDLATGDEGAETTIFFFYPWN